MLRPVPVSRNCSRSRGCHVSPSCLRSSVLLGGLGRSFRLHFWHPGWSLGKRLASGSLTEGVAMCKRCVVETGWIADLEADVEGYVVNWWPEWAGEVPVHASEWRMTKDRLAGFGEALMMVGAVQLGEAVLSLAALAVDRSLIDDGIVFAADWPPPSVLFALDEDMRAGRF